MQISPGIHMIQVPTPFPVGAVNCYLLEGDPLTIIDTGIKSSLAYTKMQEGLKDAGYSIADIQQICLTHGHVDHIGLVETIVRESNHQVDVWIHEMDQERILDYEGYISQRMNAYHRIARDSGVPMDDGILENNNSLKEYFLKYGESTQKVRNLVERQTITTGLGDLHVVWVPGHSLGSVCFALDRKKVLFSGDHILGDISSNPSLDFDGVMGISILNYFDSLNKVRKYAGYQVLPGHRNIVDDLVGRIDDLFEDYKTKIEDAAQIISEIPLSIYELSRKLYGNYDSGQLVLALAETTDLVRVLERNGKGRLVVREGVRYAVI